MASLKPAKFYSSVVQNDHSHVLSSKSGYTSCQAYSLLQTSVDQARLLTKISYTGCIINYTSPL